MCNIDGLVQLSWLCIIVVLTVFLYKSNIENGISNSAADHQRPYSKLGLVTAGRGCILPPHPSSGWWSIVHSPTNKTEQIVPHATILQINCNASYTLDGCRVVVCLNGQWTPEIGKCLKTCPSLSSQSALKVTCTYKNSVIENCTNPVDGTQALFTCAHFYKDIRRNRRKIYCDNGKWSENVTECVPVCGQATINPTLIINGEAVKKGDFPWQVAIYRENSDGYKNLICSGSLLNERLIVTAAHCVTDDEGLVRPTQPYTVAAGKYYREFNDTRDFQETQFSSIYEIIVHETYRSYHQNFLGDIALLVTNKTFVFSARVQPICIDWEEDYKDDILEFKISNKGQVSGWGYTVQDNKPSSVLKNLNIPLIKTEKCEKELPEEFLDYFTHDKICAGYLNKGTSVCKGDSGGGLVLKLGIKYYIFGIVSVSPVFDSTSSCNSDQYALYTQIYHYMDEFILPNVLRKPDFGVKTCEQDFEHCSRTTSIENTTPPSTSVTTGHDETIGDCPLPNHPANGRWSVSPEWSPNQSPGHRVLAGTILQFSCNKDYKFNGNTIVTCVHGTWTPEIGSCLKTCPDLHNTSIDSVTCKHKKTDLENCIGAFDGTIAKFKCAPFYESKKMRNFPIYCSDGVWLPEIPECIPSCGQKAKRLSTQGPYPWHVAIYNEPHRIFVCSGTLLSEKIVITAAHCVTNEKGALLPIEYLSVAAGKFYKKYNDRRDQHLTQFSSVDEILIPPDYGGYLKHYSSDVALIVVKRAFELSARVQPVCVDWNKEHESLVLNPRKESNRFFMSGWGYYIKGTNPLEQVSLSRVSLFPREECNADLLNDFEAYMTDDKLCSLGLDETECRTYAGTGLVFEEDGRFYIAGVFSVSSQGDLARFPCGEYHFFTLISYHIDNFIRKRLK